MKYTTEIKQFAKNSTFNDTDAQSGVNTEITKYVLKTIDALSTHTFSSPVQTKYSQVQLLALFAR